MTDELKPVRCGCGGEVAVLFGVYKGHEYYIAKCWGCGTQTVKKRHKAEAIEAWNLAMGNRMELQTVERTAKVRDWSEDVFGHYRCDKCGFVLGSDYVYCPNCGCRLEWK